jgi:uncharacterized DUF497 family protein
MAAGDFRWNENNVEHAQRHGCRIEEIEAVVARPGRGYPRKIGNGKFLVVGRGLAGRVIEVIFVRDADETMYVIHAQQISTRRRHRRI